MSPATHTVIVCYEDRKFWLMTASIYSNPVNIKLELFGNQNALHTVIKRLMNIMSRSILYTPSGKRLHPLHRRMTRTGISFSGIPADETGLMLEELLEDADTLIDVGIWGGQFGSKVLTWSRGIHRIFGIPVGSVITGMGAFLRAAHPDDRDRLATLMFTLEPTARSIMFDHRVVRPNGEVRWVQQRARVIPATPHTPARVLGMVIDITDRIHRETAMLEQERLRLALEKETALRKQREEFARTVSHEFRAPLGSMRTAVDMLQRYADRLTPEGRAERLTHIGEKIGSLATLIDDLTLLLRTETGTVAYPLTRIDLTALCQDLLQDYAARCPLAHINTPGALDERVVAVLPNAPVQVRGHARILRRALENLIGNALKYSPPDHPVYLTLASDPGGKMASIRVQDAGIGIPSNDIERLFTPFYRASNAENLPGTGLGLAIAHQSVLLHGGTITVESEVGVGTTFIISLPLAEN